MKSFHRRIAVVALFVFAQLAFVQRAPAQVTSQTLMVPMADGVKLATDVHLPENDKSPVPVILIRTPYGKGMGKGLAANLCPQGYAVVAQDMRGRFDSEGHHAIIFGNDGLGGKHQDGHDTIRWIVQQEWCNGKIATWGGSALGIVQNMTAPNAPPALKGQVVIVAFSNYYEQAAYQGGVWREELLAGWLKSQKMEDVNLPTFLEHSTYDDFWHGLNAEAHASEVDAPGLYVGGWYDIFLEGTINSFTTIQEKGGPNARGKCFLVIGPQAHGAFSHKVDYPKGTQSPINMIAPMNLLAFWLKGDKDAVKNLKPVNYYVMGDTTDKNAPGNVWRSSDHWPPPAQPRVFYFQPDQSLSADSPGEEKKLTYRYDPKNPVPTIGGQNLLITKGPMDQREVESRGDVLLFTTEPLAEPLEVTGHITADLFISSDGPDTDFTVKLCDVYPDGKSMLVTDGIQRASLRKGLHTRELLKAGETYPVSVKLGSTSIIFNKGHRIRVAVSSSNAPRFEPNPNTGDPHLTPDKTRIAENTLYIGREMASHITLPTGR